MPPAMVGPAAAETATVTAIHEMPRPRNLAGMMKRTSAPAMLISAAPPTPCTMRASVSTSSELE